MTEQEDIDRAEIIAACADQGLTVRDWRTDPDDGLTASCGTVTVLVDGDEDMGPFEDDEGELIAQIVGAAEHRNRRVHFSFIGEGMDAGVDVDPQDVEQL